MPDMLELPSTPSHLPEGGVRALLRELGSEDEYNNPPYPWTGRIHLDDAATGRSADLWIHEGNMYAAHMSNYIPPIALRLRSAGCMDDDQYLQVADMLPSDVGPYVMENGWAAPIVVQEVHREIMLATVTHLYDWEFATWFFVEDDATGDYVTSGVPMLLVASAVDERIGQWRAVTRVHPHVVQPTAVPQPGPLWAEKAGDAVTPELATLLKYVDGYATIAQIAGACGFTRFEAARLLSQAAADGILAFTMGPAVMLDVPSEDDAGDMPDPTEQALPIIPMLSDAPLDGRDAQSLLISLWHRVQAARVELDAVTTGVLSVAAALNVDLHAPTASVETSVDDHDQSLMPLDEAESASDGF